MGDRRSNRTRTSIKQAFLTLLNDKAISKITISEISNLADIGRGTFYLHYQDVYALFSEIESDMFEQFDQFYDESFPIRENQDILNFLNKLTAYIDHNKTLFFVLTNPEDKLITSAKFKHFFKEKILQEMREHDRSNKEMVFGATDSLFIASGVMGVIEDWIVSGMEEDRTEMSLSIQKLLLKLEE